MKLSNRNDCVLEDAPHWVHNGASQCGEIQQISSHLVQYLQPYFLLQRQGSPILTELGTTKPTKCCALSKGIDLTLWLPSCSAKISRHKSTYIKVWQCNFGWITMVLRVNLEKNYCNAKLGLMAGLPSHRGFGNGQFNPTKDHGTCHMSWF